jgi:hypothetical protein
MPPEGSQEHRTGQGDTSGSFLRRAVSSAAWVMGSLGDAPGRIRTCDPQLRRLLLYPTELRALLRKSIIRQTVSVADHPAGEAKTSPAMH